MSGRGPAELVAGPGADLVPYAKLSSTTDLARRVTSQGEGCKPGYQVDPRRGYAYHGDRPPRRPAPKARPSRPAPSPGPAPLHDTKCSWSHSGVALDHECGGFTSSAV